MTGRWCTRCLPGLVVTVALATGCGWSGGTPRSGPAIAEVVESLPPLELPEPSRAAPSREDVMAAYQRIYGRLPSARSDRSVGKRLADLSMHAGEEQDIAGAQDPYGSAITLYESLLEQEADKDHDEILYQLARAHDLAGRRARSLHYLDRLVAEHPESRYRLEARFRRAEIAFSDRRWADAGADYRWVADQGRETPYWQNASYMHGWSVFKQGTPEEALASFFAVIDSIVPAGEQRPVADADKELLNDALRVMTLTLGYLKGARTLAEQMRILGRPPWQYLAYRSLAESYHQRERYLDSVATWQTFIDDNPLDPRAPRAHLGMIDTLRSANFPSEVQPQKDAFVSRYGIRSAFWAAHGPEIRATYLSELSSFLEELAQLAHAQAQQSGQRTHFLAAADRYAELVATFPQHPQTPEYLFLLGEAYTEAGEHGTAVAAYQRVVREFPNDARGREAGYAAILGLDRLAAGAGAGERELWQRVKIDAQIEFAFVFAGDPRAPEVQADAADGLYRLGDHQEAVELSENLLSAWPELPWRLRRAALTIQGHGRFELGRYADAEAAYRELLAGPVTDEVRADLVERLLAAIYRQAEAAELAGDVDTAVTHYLRLSDAAPGAELAVKGHHDAVAALETAGRPGQAAALLASFRRAHAEHPLARDATRRLASLYEQTGDPLAAAGEYSALAEGDADPEVRRQALYRAAELYLEQQDTAAAIVHFRRFAERYPAPLNERLEAVHHLDVLHQRMEDAAGRRRWLEEKIAIRRAMGGDATERANYLAAEAHFELAGEAREAFDAVRLGHPLAESLARKQRALQAAVQAYEAVAGYGVVEFSTASTYRMGTLFTDLARSIMDSDRPDGLSELEREQYEILLEEQAFPFEERAIGIHEINMRRSWQGQWDDWIERSFSELGHLMPARFDKHELEVTHVETIH